MEESSAYGVFNGHDGGVCLVLIEGFVQVLKGIALQNIQGCIIKKTGCLFMKAALESLYGDAHAKGP